MVRSLRYAFAAVLVVLAVVAVPAVAGAGPPETQTVTGKATETFVDVVPMCQEGGSPYEITLNYNFVEHSTVSDSGAHFTFTQTGTFVAVALEEGHQDAAGRFTIWSGFNQNPGGAVSGTFTFSVRGQFEDGTRINTHDTDHFNVTPNGAEFFFTHCHD
jgi:hypothetical protein